jgi:hypothetical protein
MEEAARNQCNSRNRWRQEKLKKATQKSNCERGKNLWEVAHRDLFVCSFMSKKWFAGRGRTKRQKITKQRKTSAKFVENEIESFRGFSHVPRPQYWSHRRQQGRNCEMAVKHLREKQKIRQEKLAETLFPLCKEPRYLSHLFIGSSRIIRHMRAKI